MTYSFPSLESQVERTVAGLPKAMQSQAKVVASPYRICPIGAHIDHQGGPVLGVAIDAYTVLAFAPAADATVRLTSADFEGQIEFDTSNLSKTNDWGRYCRGAVFALEKLYPGQVKRGWTGHISGRLLGAGLSSSASAGVAYLMAFAEVNGLSLTKSELVELDRLIENEYLGLNNGVQDQTTIIYGRADGIIRQDTVLREVEYATHPSNLADVSWLIIFSGYTRELTSSDFNKRVGECWEAAGLMVHGGKILGDVPAEIYRSKRGDIPGHLMRRADHFFTECERVNAGYAAWKAGDFCEFGSLMDQSCASSINQYECGSDPLIKLHQIASETDGVIGSRFSGGGYGGCLLALCEAGKAEQAIKQILKSYRPLYPEKAEICHGWIVDGVDGARIISHDKTA